MRTVAIRAALVFLVAAMGCGVSAETNTRIADDDAVPFDLLASDAPPLVPPATAVITETVAMCFVQEQHLAIVNAVLDPPVTLMDAISALAEPPPEGEAARLRTALADTSIVREVRLVAGIARVDLRAAISTLGGDNQLLAVAQIVCTLTGRPGVGQVSFTLEGAPVEVPQGDGSLSAAPVSRDNYAALFR